MITTIINIFEEYFYSFLHPFKVHTELLNARKKLNTTPRLRIASWGEELTTDKRKFAGMGLVELISMSWLFVIIRAIYSLISINLAISAYLYYFAENKEGFQSLFSTMTVNGQKMLLLYVIGEAALYPVMLWFYIKLWSVLIRFFGNLFECDGDVDLMTEQVVSYSLVSHMFLLIPIFGEVFRYFSSIIYIFAGLKNNMRFSLLQSVIVISSPLLLLLMLCLVIIAYIIAVISVF